MKEVVIYNDNEDLLASVFIDVDGEVKAIVQDGYKVSVDGKELSK